MQKFEFLRQPLLGELAMSRKKREEREREREKMPIIVATYVYASSQGQRTHSARTNYKNFLYNSVISLIDYRNNKMVSNFQFQYQLFFSYWKYIL